MNQLSDFVNGGPTLYTWRLIPRIVCGLVHPSYTWINPRLIPCQSLGSSLTHFNSPWVVRHQVVISSWLFLSSARREVKPEDLGPGYHFHLRDQLRQKVRSGPETTDGCGTTKKSCHLLGNETWPEFSREIHDNH